MRRRTPSKHPARIGKSLTKMQRTTINMQSFSMSPGQARLAQPVAPVQPTGPVELVAPQAATPMQDYVTSPGQPRLPTPATPAPDDDDDDKDKP
jgi:hypothetical protein